MYPCVVSRNTPGRTYIATESWTKDKNNQQLQKICVPIQKNAIKSAKQTIISVKCHIRVVQRFVLFYWISHAPNSNYSYCINVTVIRNYIVLQLMIFWWLVVIHNQHHQFHVETQFLKLMKLVSYIQDNVNHCVLWLLSHESFLLRNKKNNGKSTQTTQKNDKFSDIDQCVKQCVLNLKYPHTRTVT